MSTSQMETSANSSQDVYYACVDFKVDNDDSFRRDKNIRYNLVPPAFEYQPEENVFLDSCIRYIG